MLRYGNTRENVLGLEVVLPDGSVWHGLNALRKNNTGFDLKHLFIGSEGTLGIVTAACLKVHPLPTSASMAWVGVRDAGRRNWIAFAGAGRMRHPAFCIRDDQ